MPIPSLAETGGSNLLEEHHFGINGSVLKLRTKTDGESGPRAELAGTRENMQQEDSFCPDTLDSTPFCHLIRVISVSTYILLHY